MACIALSPLSSVLWKNYVAVLLFMTHTHTNTPSSTFCLVLLTDISLPFFAPYCTCQCQLWKRWPLPSVGPIIDGQPTLGLILGCNSGYRASENMSARNKVENEVEKYRCDMWLEWWPDLTELFPLAPPCSQLVPPGQLKSAPRGLGPLMPVNPCENDDISVNWANRNHSNHSDPTQYCSVGWKKEWHGTAFAPDKYNVSSNRCKVC